MIFGLLRAGAMAFVVLTLVYLMVSVYSRSVRREKLEDEWDSNPANEGAAPDDRTAYIESGMAAYRGSLRRKLILLVYIIPMAAVLATVYAVNYQ